MIKPLVSVVVPTKNSSEFLEACLRSVKLQTYENIELIVVDNFSTDNTVKIAENFTSNIYLQGPERSSQRNYGVGLARGKYVLVIDSDMVLTADVIKECESLIKITPIIASVIIPEVSYGIGFWAQCKALERQFYIGVDWMEAARFFSRLDYLAQGGYDPTMISGEDWDLSQRINLGRRISRTAATIRHNEGHLKLFTLLKKKSYYAKHFKHYMVKTNNHPNLQNQVGISARYKLFLTQPDKLLRNPLLGTGMLFMKTAEFAVGGITYLTTKPSKHQEES